MDTPRQADSRRNMIAGMTLFAVALAAGLGLGAFLFLGPAAPLAPKTPLFATLPLSTRVSSAPAPVTGAPAPDFTLKTLDGGEVTLSDLRGRPVLINFWASWCVPCRVEMPELVRAYEENKEAGFVILGVNLTYQDSLTEVKAFAQEFGMTFPVLLDETGEVTDDLYRLRGLPLTVFVNREGVITRLHLGAMTREQIDEFVGEILK